MVGQESSYLDGPIHTLVEIFETGIENLEKTFPKFSLKN